MIQWLKSRVNSGLLSDLVWWIIIIIGIILRLRQYIANRSLWLDEASLALNIVGRSFTGLTQPLDFEQGAPLGFLFIEKAVLLVLGNQDYILRLFPLISGLFAIYFMYLISKEYIGMPGLLALSIFVISWTLIYYSSELKQYSSDVLMSAGLLYLAFPVIQKEAGRREILLLGVGGVISLWISHPAIFVIASIGLVLAIEYLHRKTFFKLAWILGMGAVWIIDFGVVYLVSLRYLMGNSYLQKFWQPFFMPLPPWRHVNWFGSAYLGLLGIVDKIGSVPSWHFALISSILLILGMGWYFVRNRAIAFMLVLPFVFVLLASALQKYPFGERLGLFMLPFLFLLMAKGLEQIYLLLARWNKMASLVACTFFALVLLWPLASTSFHFFLKPYLREDVRSALTYLSQNDQAGDVIYVYSQSRVQFEYYAPSFNLEGDKVVFGAARVGKVDVSDLNQLRGNRRVWLVFSSYCSKCAASSDVSLYAQYLRKIGKQIDYARFTNASLFLYDLANNR